jgi:hypothetical protein
MTFVPQLGPEVYVEDADDIAKEAMATVSPLLSPGTAANRRGSFIAHGLDSAARHRRGTSAASLSGFASPGIPGFAGSTGLSPQMSPRTHHQHSNSAFSTFSFEGGELASPGGGSGQSSRRGSAAENVLEVLDNSAWGESIRRSFTMRRPPGEGHS